MAKKSNIEIILSARDANMNATLTRSRAALKAFTSEVGAGSGQLASMRTQVLQLVGTFAGLSAIGDIGAMLKAADQNAYGLAASIKAANREFAVGSAGEWEQTVGELSAKLRIYSKSDITGAAAKTIDMTKRLGLNAEQMKQVIALSGDLAAGRTDMAGAVERVTAALRGEAEASEFLGLTLNENYVKAWYEASVAHEKAWKDLNDLEKAQIRYNVFLEQALPLQGKAAESINTWSGALAYVKATVSDSIGSNEDLARAMADVGTVLRENAGEIGKFAADIATGAAAVIEFVAANREVIIAVLKYGAAFSVAFSVISKLAMTWRGLNAAMAVMTGMQIVPWLRAVEAGSIGTTAAITGLKVGFIGLMGATAVFFAAYQAGEWLTMRNAIAGTAEAQQQLATSSRLVAEKFKEVSSSTGLTITSMEQLDQAVKDGKIHYDQLTGTWKAGAEQQQAATKQTATVMKQATGEALTAMQKKYQDYVTQVRALQEQIAGRERSLASELRDLSRSGMSDVSAWRDRKKEADQYAQAAKDAAATAKASFAAGDTIGAEQMFKTALQYADDAKQAYKSLNTEVKSGDQVVVSQQQALKTAMEGIKKAGESGIEILKMQQQVAKESMSALTRESGMVDLEKGMDAAEKKWLDNWKAMEAFATEQVETVRKRIDALVEDRHVTVWVTEKIKRAEGGTAMRFASGGSPLNLYSGRKLPGFGGGDKIDASLEAGEMVINKYATAAMGMRGSYAWNNQQWDIVLEELLKRTRVSLSDRLGYSLGGLSGMLPGSPQMAAAPSVSGATMTVNLNFGGGDMIPVTTSSTADARRLVKKLEWMAQRSSR